VHCADATLTVSAQCTQPAHRQEGGNEDARSGPDCHGQLRQKSRTAGKQQKRFIPPAHQGERNRRKQRVPSGIACANARKDQTMSVAGWLLNVSRGSAAGLNSSPSGHAHTRANAHPHAHTHRIAHLHIRTHEQDTHARKHSTATNCVCVFVFVCVHHCHEVCHDTPVKGRRVSTTDHVALGFRV
jgi:hypothetical protein